MEFKPFLGVVTSADAFAQLFAKPKRTLLNDERTHLGTTTIYNFLALLTLGENLTALPVISLSGSESTYKSDSDACDFQVWCTILQEQPTRTNNPIDYCSRSFRDAEWASSSALIDCLGIILSRTVIEAIPKRRPIWHRSRPLPDMLDIEPCGCAKQTRKLVPGSFQLVIWCHAWRVQ